jgi:hypothetical protein
MAAVGLVFSGVAIYYITVLKSGFAGLRRLKRPWLVLEFGVASLIVAALSVPWPVSTSVDVLHLVQIVAVVVAAFFILTAMVMMKQAWTIREGD